MNSKNTYISLSIVFVASMVATIFLPVGEIVRSLSAIPAMVSLLGVIFQVMRDRIAHERALLIIENQNSFSIGATSHMANVAFDKYALFCEEYVAEMFMTLKTLTRDGPRESALPHSSSLLDIRKKWAVWLSPEIETKLGNFEAALRKIGSSAWLLEKEPGHGPAIKEMYSAFAEVLGLEKWDDKEITGEITITAILKKLRQVLGTDELNSLRSALIKRAIDNISPKLNIDAK